MIWKTTNARGQQVTWYSEEEYKKLINALEQIRELQIDCKGCNGDCMWCNSGSRAIYEIADNILNEVKHDPN